MGLTASHNALRCRRHVSHHRIDSRLMLMALHSHCFSGHAPAPQHYDSVMSIMSYDEC